ncbi:major facilitator superfamily transporter [Plectosphaerella plurivora]|uniref:Major facilitator superfamily transporter n=1 Tax=Plectosphaerella plurivora TaxID=936078 RepID=A0A9P8V6W7_9PEZI|nr:major facilitator superfamily transporter [Plectosphaerella plurivora]
MLLTWKRASSSRQTTPVFSTFSLWQKRWILFLAAFASMFSPMSSFIFYPAITSIANDLRVSVDLINLAVTTYMIVSGVVPALIGNAADNFGRRPVYLLVLSIYFVANLGLSLQNTYAGLLVLRMLQSAGSSGTISLGYGVIADITTTSERGFYVGILLLGPNVAPPVGPVLGGVLAARLGWKWIFWFLCILGGACLALILFTLPETCRVIVGNGSEPARGIYQPLLSTIMHSRKPPTATELPARQQGRFADTPIFPNPIACLKILLVKDLAIILFSNGIYYAIYCCIQASLSTLFIDVYEFETIEAGLIYIPFGIACLLSTLTWGRFMDVAYKSTAAHHGLPAGIAREESVYTFPIRAARLKGAISLVVISGAATVGYGWSIHHQVHIAVPLVLQALVGFGSTALFVALGTLLTDLNAGRSSTAAASANLVRCALAAPALAAVQPMIDGIGVGWCFTLFGALAAMCAPLLCESDAPEVESHADREHGQ